MALTWDWDECVGTVEWTYDGKGYRANLYKGNALLIEIYEWHDELKDKDVYSLHNFLCDEQHLKNCIKDNLDFSGYEYTFFKDKLNNWRGKQFERLAKGLTKMGADVVIRVRV